jgi:ligand-binding SRPBCC domain-containing protein
MGAGQLTKVQRLPISMEDAWAFFSSPRNLKHITPPEMRFEILSNSGSEVMYPGQVITYHVRPLLGIKMFWMTEITHVEEGRYFVDEQRIGPYSLWHHQHHFKPINGGVEMTDIVSYRVPLGFLGELLSGWLVRKKLEAIFEYRFKVLSERFGQLKP